MDEITVVALGPDQGESNDAGGRGGAGARASPDFAPQAATGPRTGCARRKSPLKRWTRSTSARRISTRSTRRRRRPSWRPRPSAMQCGPAATRRSRLLRAHGARLNVLAGVTQANLAAVSALAAGLPAVSGVCTVTASALGEHRVNPSLALLVTELNSRLLAGEVKLRPAGNLSPVLFRSF